MAQVDEFRRYKVTNEQDLFMGFVHLFICSYQIFRSYKFYFCYVHVSVTALEVIALALRASLLRPRIARDRAHRPIGVCICSVLMVLLERDHIRFLQSDV